MWSHRLRLAGICLLASLCAGAMPVAAQPGAPVLPGSADEAFLAARDAAKAGDLDRIALHSQRMLSLEPEHPLAVWPEHWMFGIRFKRAASGAGEPVPLDQVRAWLARNDGTAAADLTRRDWLLLLGKQRDFITFDIEYPRFQLNDDAQVSCYALLSRYVRRDDVLDAARAAIGVPRDLGEGCGALADALAADGKLRRDDIWIWVRLAFDANTQAAARRYVALLPDAEAGNVAKALDQVYDKPLAWLTRQSGELRGDRQELAVLALARMARSEPEQTAALFQRNWAARLPAESRRWIWAQIGAAAAKKLAPETVEWTRKSLGVAGLSEETLAWQARGALRAQDWPLLHALIDSMPPEMRRPGGEGTWIYWLGRALKAEGKPAEAAAQYRLIAGQYNFYGQLALEELGERIVTPPRPAVPSDAELAVVKNLPGFIRAFRFYQIGLRAPGNLEWNFTLRGMADRQLLAAAEWARRNAVLDRAVNTADRTRSEHDFGVRFLAPFRDQLQPRVAEQGLDLAWVYGLIRQESRFVTDARSSVGAAGLMQIMPSTAKYVARKIGMQGYQPGASNDPDTNLTLGTNYLRMVLIDLDSLPVLATAAYNAGPGRSRSWRASLSRPVEGAIFAETIPFPETRDYVKKVMSNAAYYANLFDGRGQSLKARLGIITPKGMVPDDLP